MMLEVYLDSIYAIERSIAQSTQDQYKWSIRNFEKWLGRSATFDDLSDLSVSQWLRDMELAHRSPSTVKAKRRDLLVIWRDIAERGLCDPPHRVRKPIVPVSIPEAWTLREMRRLMVTALVAPGEIGNGIPRRWYFSALFATAYDTGLRRGDLLRLDLPQRQSVVMLQRKTGVGHVSWVSIKTLRRLRRISKMLRGLKDPHWMNPLRWPHDLTYLSTSIRKIVTAAGISHGGLQKIRRTGATAVCAAGDDPMRYLGHKTPGLAYRSYVDRTKLGTAIQPPRIA